MQEKTQEDQGNEEHLIDPNDTTLAYNINLYFKTYGSYSRFHYSSLYTYARAVVNKCPCSISEKLLKAFDQMYFYPFVYFTNALPYPSKVYYKKISISRIEYIIWRDTQFLIPLSKVYRIDRKHTIEIGQFIDLLDLYKQKMHEFFDSFMTVHQLTTKLILPEIKDVLLDEGKERK